MQVKFLKPYGIHNPGETADLLKSKAAQLKAQGIITDDPIEIRSKKKIVTKAGAEGETKKV